MSDLRVHELKCWPEQFGAILRSEKRHEFRRDDRGFHEGDVLHLREWNPETQAYTPYSAWATVTHISRGGCFGIPVGYVVMSIELGAKKVLR